MLSDDAVEGVCAESSDRVALMCFVIEDEIQIFATWKVIVG
jgi:hypothetical protein